MATRGRKTARKSARTGAKSASKVAARSPARAPAKAPAKTARKAAGGASRDYLFVSKNKRLVVFHGNSGNAHELSPEDTGKVLELLKQRQKYASKISAHLKKRGFSVATARIIDSNEN
jgi:hypothetical protein